MGIYLNPDNKNFEEVLNAKIYIDKSMLINCTNEVVNTPQKYVCVSRPRRFGKSITAEMISAYYGKNESKELFKNLKISKSQSYEKYINKFDVIHINMQNFLNPTKDFEENLEYLQKRLIFELQKEFCNINYFDNSNLLTVFEDIYSETKSQFVFVIDEWDSIFRVYKNDKETQKRYLDFLRNLLKDQSYVALAYMTGILPIKKYGQHSALNMFTEVSMTNAREYAEFTGFTEEEVKKLCKKYNMSFEETKRWYDGYNLKGMSIYNPRSVVMSMTGGDFDSYWTQTETYEALKVYIQMNYDGLRDTIIELIAGQRKRIDTITFANDMVTFNSADDVLTLLVHLGYLGYDFYTEEVFIPNYEIEKEFVSTVKTLKWDEVVKSVQVSDKLLEATIQKEEKEVEEIIESVHDENTSIFKYNDENSLSCVVSLAYYAARKEYIMYREMKAGKGVADIVFIPRVGVEKPAFVVELKCNKSASAAIEQIKNKEYVECLKDYKGKILLVGINYDKETKRHECKIEEVAK